jgi:hypothetical protein
MHLAGWLEVLNVEVLDANIHCQITMFALTAL